MNKDGIIDFLYGKMEDKIIIDILRSSVSNEQLDLFLYGYEDKKYNDSDVIGALEELKKFNYIKSYISFNEAIVKYANIGLYQTVIKTFDSIFKKRKPRYYIIFDIKRYEFISDIESKSSFRDFPFFLETKVQDEIESIIRSLKSNKLTSRDVIINVDKKYKTYFEKIANTDIEFREIYIRDILYFIGWSDSILINNLYLKTIEEIDSEKVLITFLSKDKVIFNGYIVVEGLKDSEFNMLKKFKESNVKSGEINLKKKPAVSVSDDGFNKLRTRFNKKSIIIKLSKPYKDRDLWVLKKDPKRT